jgi:hypothetical protein
VFLHQRDSFWETTTKSPGILINDQTITQVQIKYDDIRTLASEINECSYYKQGTVHNLHTYCLEHPNNYTDCLFHYLVATR